MRSAQYIEILETTAVEIPVGLGSEGGRNATIVDQTQSLNDMSVYIPVEYKAHYCAAQQGILSCFAKSRNVLVALRAVSSAIIVRKSESTSEKR